MKIWLIIIAFLVIVIGFLIAKFLEKRNTNIIKLLIKRDLLPPPAEDTKWIEGAQCYMGDGSIGKTKGNYCEQIRPL